MRTSQLAAVGMCVIALGASGALGQMECVRITRVSRVISGSSGASANLAGTPVCIETDSDSRTSEELDHVGMLSLLSTCSDSRGISVGYCNNTERSSLSPARLSAEASVLGVGEVDHFAFQQAAGSGRVELEIDLDVTLARPFSLSVNVLSQIEGLMQPTVASAMFTMSGPGLEVSSGAVVQRSNSAETDSLEIAGVLSPGVYTLRAVVMATGQTVPTARASGYATYTIDLRIDPAGPANPRCPQDWNYDGRIDSADVFDFLQDLFVSGADFNGDCVVNSTDFFEFITRFFETCD